MVFGPVALPDVVGVASPEPICRRGPNWRADVLASPPLGRLRACSLRVIEPIVRWTFAGRGYALVHAGGLANGDHACLVTAKTETEKTITCLKTLDGGRYRCLPDGLTLLSPDGRGLTYAKPLAHTLKAGHRPLLSRLGRLMLLRGVRATTEAGS
jgi:hypothetical protein